MNQRLCDLSQLTELTRQAIEELTTRRGQLLARREQLQREMSTLRQDLHAMGIQEGD